MVHLYIGEGKGKTTAAMGLALRGLAAGWRVVIVQFLKSTPSGEVDLLRTLGATFFRGKPLPKFVWDMNDEERRLTRQSQDESLRLALDEPADMLILDEACGAVETSMVDEALLREAVSNRATSMEVVMTGRNPAPWMEELADYETEMRALKHPYDRGIAARRGVEM